MTELERIYNELDRAQSARAGRKQWKPTHCGNIDIRIAADGRWYHEGRVFQRQALVKLFASVLYIEDGIYYLRTPAEQLRISVDDAPFLATMLDVNSEQDQQALVFTTNLGDRVVADRDHRIWVDIDQSSQLPNPYIHIRDGLNARISRSAFFDLANAAKLQKSNGADHLMISSMGINFDLGRIDDNE